MSTSGQRASLLTSSFEAVVATGEGPEAAPWARTTSRQRQMRAMRVRGFHHIVGVVRRRCAVRDVVAIDWTGAVVVWFAQAKKKPR